MLYVDTSVVAAYYCPEPLSAQAETALRTTVRPAISDLTEVELYAAVARKVRDAGMTRADAHKVIAQFRGHVQKGRYTMLIVERGHYQVAREWFSQLKWPLRTLDALHLAIALSSEATVLTADSRMARCAPLLDIPARLLSV